VLRTKWIKPPPAWSYRSLGSPSRTAIRPDALAPIRTTSGGILSHGALLNISAQINSEGVARVEFESDAPRIIDMDYVASWNESFQRMKVKPSKFDLFRRRCGVKAGRNRIVSP
jgi:hypothetical protein